MGKRKRNKLKRGRDVTKVLQRNGCRVRNGKGSHMVGTLPSGKKVVYYHGKLSTGVRHKVRKALVAAGLLIFMMISFAIGGYLALML